MHKAHGDVIAVYNGTTPTNTYAYDAFGNSSSQMKFGYCDQQYDFETGLYYLRARYYDSNTGRFITEDPTNDSSNWYSYCYNEPINYADSGGLSPYPIRKIFWICYVAKSAYNLMYDTFSGNAKFDEMINGVIADLPKYDFDITNSFGYDYSQNVFYFKNNAPQNQFGYTNFYDNTSALLDMVIDNRTINFEYGEKYWRVELWKGNYNYKLGIAGGEIGIYYNTDKSSYYSVAEEEYYPNIMMTIRTKLGKCFTREGIDTWWQTGFQMGSDKLPQELIMDAKITFKKPEMCAAFYNAVKNGQFEGVTISEDKKNNKTVHLTWT